MKRRSTILAASVIVLSMAATCFGDFFSPKQSMRAVFPDPRHWISAHITLNELVAGADVQIIAGETIYFGGPTIVSVRALQKGKIVRELSYAWTDPGALFVVDRGDRIEVVTPAGLVLLELDKQPNQSPELMPVLRTATAHL